MFPMKDFLKLFLVFLYVIFSLIGNTCSADYTLPQRNVSSLLKAEQTQSVLLGFDIINDTAIASSNNNGYEISALKNDNESSIGILDNTLSTNVFYDRCLKKYYLNTFLFSSHNLSADLENEIYVRAP